MTERDEAVALLTCEAIIAHLREVAPTRTLTARAIINQGIMERLYG